MLDRRISVWTLEAFVLRQFLMSPRCVFCFILLHSFAVNMINTPFASNNYSCGIRLTPRRTASFPLCKIILWNGLSRNDNLMIDLASLEIWVPDEIAFFCISAKPTFLLSPKVGQWILLKQFQHYILGRKQHVNSSNNQIEIFSLMTSYNARFFTLQ